jgi:Synergist-CTERM protein sorting domain-containing protein
LSPWLVNTGGVGGIPDEDKTLPSGQTLFAAQAASEVPAPADSGGGGGGGCGFLGLEPVALMALAALARRRRNKA